ncbi:MAG TPA: DUF72 domain-containing protein [Alphaproteobacteria bacterium]|jgi:uncharacterized protein YecE (DUF72 family)|nr:DUF72 domain-containing protein [Alphaproteobacteria bacterium]
MTRARAAAHPPRPSRSAKRGAIRIGISGWRYKPWRGAFYPEDLPQKDELRFASRQLPTIEINGTFYSLQRPSSFAHWAEETPDGFMFAVKGPRYITHIRWLKDVETPLANFYGSGVLGLGPKLGPFLWQFPPNFKFDAERIEAFFKLLPHDAATAASLARRKADRARVRPTVKDADNFPLRHAMEIRNETFRDPAFVALLRRYRIGMVCADTVDWPRLMDVTADFIYCRLHGSVKLYTSGYGDKALDQWAARIDYWSRGHDAPDGDRASPQPAPKRKTRDVFVYFDNDVKVRAPRDAHSLIVKLEALTGRSLESEQAVPPEQQRAMDERATEAKPTYGPRARSRRTAARKKPSPSKARKSPRPRAA